MMVIHIWDISDETSKTISVDNPCVRKIWWIAGNGGRRFKHLSVTAQKVYYGADAGMHGARLDVYMEAKENPEGKAAVYDVEPERKSGAADKKALPRRVRFYHGKIVARRQGISKG